MTRQSLAGFVFLAVAVTNVSAQDATPEKKPSAPTTNAVPDKSMPAAEKKATTDSQKSADADADQPAAAPKPSSTSGKTVELDPKWMQALPWRSIGPAGMGGRIVDFAVVDSDPNMYWVATASGGLLKTTNNGVTFTHQFDHESTVSIGSVCVAPSNPNIVWVGTGENNPRNSVSYGDGVYKSIDGGKTWKHMGLAKSYQIGRIAIHRTNPNVVYVGALGRLYGSNEERGLYKTSDGGDTWERVLYIDEKTGIIDVQMHPTEPNTLVVAAWERMRDGYDSHPGNPLPDGYDGYDPIKKWGPGSGIYKTTNGGKDWRKLTNGLPSCNLGRVGLDYYRKDPKTLFAIVDCEKIGMGTPPQSGAAVYVDFSGEDAEGGVKVAFLRDNGPSAKAGLLAEDVIKSLDDKAVTSAEQLLEEIRNHKVGDKLKYKVQRGDKAVEIAVTLERRPETPGGGGVYLGLNGEDGENGVKVTTVADGGPASSAGIKAEDVIQSIGEKSVQSYNQILDEMRNRNSGEKVKLKVLRDEQSKEFEVVLAERPQGGGGFGGGRRGGAQPSAAYLGLNGEDAEGGVKLTTVVEDGPAAKAGLKVGDLVKTVNEKAVEKYDQLLEEIRSHGVGDKLKLKWRRGDKEQDGEVTLGERQQIARGGPGGATKTRPSSANYGGQLENVQDSQGTNSFQYGGIYKSTDGGESWTRINSLNPRPMYFSQIRVDPSNDQFLYVCGVSMYRSTNGGKFFRSDAGKNVHADQHALWVDPRDGRHLLVGCDGGFYVTYDRTANWDHLNNMAIGQFYNVAISPRQPYFVAGGLQDNGSWFGPSIGLNGGAGPINEEWLNVGGGDGFVCRVDPNDPDMVYSESQDGAISRRNVRSGERAGIRPRPTDGGATYRFNWNTPYILSSQNSHIFYCAANYVFRSLDRGNNLEIISPEITLTKWGTGTALAESPRNPNVLYAGTDDGALWLTKDGGKNWSNLTTNLGMPGSHWITSIEPSRYVEGRAYVALDCHRSDEDDPCIFVTDDFGKTWKSLRANLPWGSTRVLREDIQNPNLLFLGTEFGAWCSLDRGKYWNKFGTNFPTVAVHEFAFHPVNGEVVAATHGRSLWVLDVSALRQIKAENVADKPALYQPSTVVRWRGEPARSMTNRRFVGQNPNSGAQIYFSLPKEADKVTMKIIDISGTTVRELPTKKEPGLYRLTWDLRGTARQGRGGPGGQRNGGGAGWAGGPGGAGAGGFGGGGPGGFGGGRGGRGFGAPAVPAGTYRVVLSVDGEDFAQNLKVEPDPVISDAVPADEQQADMDEDEEEEENGNEMDAPGEQEIRDSDRDKDEKEIGG